MVVPLATGTDGTVRCPDYDWNMTGRDLLWIRFALFSPGFPCPTLEPGRGGTGRSGPCPAAPQPVGCGAGGTS